MPGTLTIPNPQGGLSGVVPALQLDQNWNAIRDYVNAREITQGTLGSRPAASTAGRLYYATDTAQLFVDSGTAWTQIGSPSGQGVWAIRRAAGGNNSVTPLTQYDVTCDGVQLRNPITGQLMSFMNPGTRTNNILTAGPTANGRDQAGAFSANSDIHLYYITNGSTLATVSSISAPTSGPVLPGGYHSWAYIGAWRLNASTQFQQTVLRGSRVTYMGITAALPGGAATIATAVSVAPFVPAVALEYELADFGWAVSSDGAGLLVAELEIYAQSSVLYGYMVKCSLGGLTPSTSQRSMPGGTMVLPNIGQAFIYRWVVTSGSSPAATLYVPSYRIANGGD